MNTKSFSYKLSISMIILFFFILFISIFSIFMINKTQVYSAETETNWLPSIVSAQKMQSAFSSISRRPLRIMLEDNKKDKEEGVKILKKAIEKFVKEKELYKELISVPDEKDTYEKLNSAWNEFLIILNQTLDLSNKELNSDAFKIFNGKGRPFQLVIESALNQITEVNNKGAIESTQKGKI